MTTKQEERPRVLIFVIAYWAETTLKQVLERIPRSLFKTYDCEVLVVDDASEDRTFLIGQEYKAAHPEMCITVLRNSFNQGYGGNQKVGYSFAIERGFDFVAMLHGDAQYAPEALPFLLEPLRGHQADAVFGSRMMGRFEALKGGMPLYKFIGNKILTRLQNAMLGTSLSEFHSGYRIYSTKLLSAIPFHLNSNDFHFDTEIIVQIVNHGARLVECPIPTYYGNEICRVNGMKYAKDVLAATWANVLHRAGVFYQRRYDTRGATNAHYDLKLGYSSSHTYALDAVPAGARVVDMGSGPGGMAGELAKKGCRVAAVDRHPPPEKLEGVAYFQNDLDDPLTFPVRDFDYLLALDVIEHLASPEDFLDRLRREFDYTPRKLVLSTPNVAFLPQRLMLLFGQFNYGKAGVLDLTHTRLFTFRTVAQLLGDAGFRVKRVRGVPAPFPKVFGDNVVGRAAVALNEQLIRVSKTLFSYQIFVEAETTPDIHFILRDTEEQSTARTRALGGGAA